MINNSSYLVIFDLVATELGDIKFNLLDYLEMGSGHT